jgi:hypothetical protein
MIVKVRKQGQGKTLLWKLEQEPPREGSRASKRDGVPDGGPKV